MNYLCKFQLLRNKVKENFLTKSFKLYCILLKYINFLFKVFRQRRQIFVLFFYKIFSLEKKEEEEEYYNSFKVQ